VADVNVSDFDFDLPAELIAQEARRRGQSRLLVVDRSAGTWHEAGIGDLPALVDPGDLLVANDTRVYPARLLGRRDPSGGAVECLLIEHVGGDEWQALVHPGQKLKPGARIVFEDPARAPGVRLSAEILERRFHGRRLIRLEADGAADVHAAIDAIGHVPLPPYIHRPDSVADRERYQTVFARSRGSVAAPTAGLHFDEALIERLREHRIGWSTVTLHVGYGTFKPVRADNVEDHVVDPEWYEIPAATVAAIRHAHEAGRRVVAVGTTTTRALEHDARRPVASSGADGDHSGMADLFIYPGFRFAVINGLLTNLHLPRSSLFMLVCAFAGRELTLEDYGHAIERRFHFYSYGDAMLVL
jgi:S-adenosylmethionine:tRNA ribosyltransferase-isomerase